VLAWEGFTDDSSAAFVFAAALLLYALPGLVVALLSLASHTSDDETRKPKRKR